MRGARGAAARRVGKAGGKTDDNTKKKSAGLFVSTVDKNGGLELPAEPLDFLGQGETLQRRWKRFMQSAMVIYEQMRAARRMIHSAFFFAYLVVFTFAVIMIMEGETLYEHHESLEKVLTEREWYYYDANITKIMSDVYTLTDFWLWLRGPFINEVLPTETGAPWDAWHGYNKSKPGNFHTNLWLLAPITLRQLRVRSDSCAVSSKAVIASSRTELDLRFTKGFEAKYHLYSQKLALDAYVSQCKEIDYEPAPAGCGHIQNKSGDWSRLYPRGQVGLTPGCYADINSETEARAPFGPIDPITNMSMWTWESAKDLKMDSWVGRSSVKYPGSGYFVKLPMDPEIARDEVKFLADNDWLDLGTRAVFIDMLVYNPNVGYISLIKLSFEFRPGQDTLVFATYKHMSIHQIFWSDTALEQMRFELVVLAMILIFSVKEAYTLRRMGRTYFYNGWHYISIFNYWLYIIGFGFRVTPFMEAKRLGFPPPLGTYENYERAFTAGENWKFCMSINSVLVWMRCFEHLTVLPFMGYIVRVLSAAVSPILVVCISFSVVIYSFALAYTLAFSGGLHQYRTIDWTITTMSRQLRGLDDFDEMWVENRLLGPIYYIMWTLIGAFIFVSLFVVVLLEEMGDISKQFNMEAIVKKLAGAVNKMNLAKKNENYAPTDAIADLKSIDAELRGAVKRLQQKEGKSFDFGDKCELKLSSADKLLALLDKAANTASQEYCEVTKDKFREIEESVYNVAQTVKQLHQQLRPTTQIITRPQTLKISTSVRTLTGSTRGASADVRKHLSVARGGAVVSTGDVTGLKASLQSRPPPRR